MVVGLVIGLPLVGLVIGVGGFGDLRGDAQGDDGLWMRYLRENHHLARHWVESSPGVALAAFGVAYFVGVTFSLPGAVWMSLLAGYLFGPWAGAGAVLLSATAGATAVFVMARFGFGEASLQRVLHRADGLRHRLQAHAFWVLLGVRLVPIFPFWLVNLIAAAVGMRLGVYVAATFIGIIPGAVLYTAAGAGLGAVLDAGRRPDLAMIWQPHILGPLVGLAVLAMVPVFVPSLRRALGGEGAVVAPSDEERR